MVVYISQPFFNIRLPAYSLLTQQQKRTMMIGFWRIAKLKPEINHLVSSSATEREAKVKKVLALPISFATTTGIEVSLSSSPYLDVSVQVVPSTYPINSDTGNRV